MKRTTRNTFASCAMPLLLLLASQGGSCGGGRTAGDNLNRNGTARSARQSPAANAGGAGPTTNSNAVAPTPTPAGADAADAGASAGTEREGDDRAGGTGGGAAMSDAQKGRLADGTWGGTGVRLEVKGGSAEVEFDCAHGRVGALTLGADGRFSARGTLAAERGGPVRLGEEPKSVPATYAGQVSGDAMTLRVSVEGDDDLDYTLRRGSAGRLHKCL